MLEEVLEGLKGAGRARRAGPLRGPLSCGLRVRARACCFPARVHKGRGRRSLARGRRDQWGGRGRGAAGAASQRRAQRPCGRGHGGRLGGGDVPSRVGSAVSVASGVWVEVGRLGWDGDGRDGTASLVVEGVANRARRISSRPKTGKCRCEYGSSFPGTCGPTRLVSGLSDRKSTRLNSSHSGETRMPSSA